MYYEHGEQVSIITGVSADDFQTKVNSELKRLKRLGAKYKMEMSPQTGFIAYFVYETKQAVPETIADEFELDGEKHHCIECPYFIRPTDGRIKYTKCSLTEKRTTSSRGCCDAFYEKLLNGEIELVEVGEIERRETD